MKYALLIGINYTGTVNELNGIPSTVGLHGNMTLDGLIQQTK